MSDLSRSASPVTRPTSPVSWLVVLVVVVASVLWGIFLLTQPDFPPVAWTPNYNSYTAKLGGFAVIQLVLVGAGIALWRGNRPLAAGILIGVLLSGGLCTLFSLCSQVWLVT